MGDDKFCSVWQVGYLNTDVVKSIHHFVNFWAFSIFEKNFKTLRLNHILTKNKKEDAFSDATFILNLFFLKFQFTPKRPSTPRLLPTLHIAPKSTLRVSLPYGFTIQPNSKMPLLPRILAVSVKFVLIGKPCIKFIFRIDFPTCTNT